MSTGGKASMEPVGRDAKNAGKFFFLFQEFLVTLQSNLCAIPLPERTEKRQKFRGKQHACERERENSPESSITPLGENDDDDGDDDYDCDDYGDGDAAKVRESPRAEGAFSCHGGEKARKPSKKLFNGAFGTGAQAKPNPTRQNVELGE
ncbi:hypothetical protein RUM43_003017 [Polyplax serrata]|uniref:Uncharacterized protein n=1 Tax=Polyplax serrata TaxID=468196 RepID=A0AAN8P2V0_POLSC